MLDRTGEPADAGIRRPHLPVGAGVLSCVVLLCALAWLVLARMAAGMRMPGMADDAMPVPDWSLADFALQLGMWVVMMVGMMLPSATPMLLLFRRLTHALPHPGARAALFAGAYLAVWSGFSLLATLLQTLLEHATLLSPMVLRAVPWLGGGLLLAAGIYQWSPLKYRCLAHCRSPLSFLLRYPVAGWRDSWRLGVAHGGYCVGCCWALMALLFAVGVMNLLWAAALSAFVLAEKQVAGTWLCRTSGALLIGWGAWVLAHGSGM